MQTSVSIIIPCYNVENYIKRTIESVLNQTSNDFELILIDDGSVDDTYNVMLSCVKDFSNCLAVKQTNKGVSAARNHGLQKASGRFVYFLDGDDRIEPDLVEKLSSYSELNTELLIMGYDHEVSRVKKKQHLPFQSHNYIKDYLSNKLYVNICSIVFSHSLIERECLSFNENTYYSEDREFIIRALNATNKVVILENVYFHYLFRQSSAMNSVTYSAKRQSSVYAMERVFKLLNNEKKLGQLALTQLDLTILLHYKLFYKSNCRDRELENILLGFLSYLKYPVMPIFTKQSIFVYIYRLLYMLNKKLFHLLLVR